MWLPPEYRRKPAFIIKSINITTKKIIMYFMFFLIFLTNKEVNLKRF